MAFIHNNIEHDASNLDRSGPTINGRGEGAPILVGLDDGYACTKLALPDGRLLMTPSRAQIGRSNVSWLSQAEQRIFEYETEGTIYSVGDVEAAATRFAGYACSGMNRAIVQHALQEAGLEGASIEAVSGLPVSHFYRSSGSRQEAAINDKQQNLLIEVWPRGGAEPAVVSFHQVIPEALAAWYDYVIQEGNGESSIDRHRLAAPIAVVDIGGRTTDTVVVQNQGVDHRASGSFEYGLLDVKAALASALQERFDLEQLSERSLMHAVERGVVRLYGRDYSVKAEVLAAKQELIERLYAETRRLLGRGVELDCVLFVGGGVMALAEHLTDWFPNQRVAPEPAFANARGMLKYRLYVSDRARMRE